MEDKRGVIIVFFDIPVTTCEKKKAYRKFYSFLEKNGYRMMQESVYIKLIRNKKFIICEKTKLKSFAPKQSNICFLPLTLAAFNEVCFISGNEFNINIFSDDIISI